MGKPQKRNASRRKPKDPAGNRSAILAAAVAEFAARGFNGARVNSIAESSGCDKQMLYYYYTNKEGLYIAALEYAYTQIRLSQVGRPIDREDPLGSLREIILASYDFVIENAHIIRLIANENVERARYIRKSAIIRKINFPIISMIEQALDAGVAKGIFRADLSAKELHLVTSALINHYINNAHTFGYIFDVDLFSAESHKRFRSIIGDVLSRYVLVAQPAATTDSR